MAKFKTRARALDLLGRQQIAGIPTAINELFKNAHDAYADNVEVDYFRNEKLLILRDNGLGMTKSDFESRWLTLGTESKYVNRKTPPPPIDPQKLKRPIMGEKGIGRLAIASIGNQVLILTKAKRENEKHKIVAAFINWNIFEIPGLDLDDVVVPIREYDKLPSIDEINSMQKELVESIDQLVKQDDITGEEGDDLNRVISGFDVSPFLLDKKLVGNFTLSEEGSGTHFYISPVDESLDHDIDGNKEATKIEKMLVGFTNTMTPGHEKPHIVAAFRDWKDATNYTDIIDKDQFFTPEDFELADHHFRGKFDEYGQFDGLVQVYREKELPHKVNWNGNDYRETACGEFSIDAAYFQGRPNQSIIDRENHARLYAKAEKFGGLYVYKDNIRILPYGNPENDWLDIEKNRAKSASFYFFNARRMFGVINISREINSALKEKAGREGFIENKAYRQFRDILKNFFQQLAADFFREGSGAGPKAEIWVKKRAEREAFYRALQRRDQQAKVRKEKFQSSLNRFFDDLSAGKFETELDQIIEKAEKQISSIAYIEEPEKASQALIDYEIQARDDIASLTSRLKVNSPRGFTISKDRRRDFEAYLEEFERLENGIIREANEKIDLLVDNYTTHLKIEVSKRKRLEEAVNFLSEQAEKAAKQKQKEAKEVVGEITKNVTELARDLMIDLEDKIREIKDGFKNIEINNKEDFDLVAERKRIEEEIGKERDKATFTMESIIKQLHAIYWDKNSQDDIITSDQISDAMSEELEELREQVQTDIELSQLGLAVGVIHHEFNSTVNSIRSSLKDLKAWADVYEKLEGVYNNIRTNFEHLDGYLTLFTPLNRRLHRSKEEISAKDIKIFLIDLFGARLERHGIKLKHTQGFQNRSLYGYRSTFYPVFVNLIDNAIHWLNQSPTNEEKVIRLHADDSGFYISNNGLEIPPKDAERIFELGFTRKLNGRGMGLHISKEVLEAESYRIFLDSPRSNSTVTFKIEPIKG